MGCLETASGWQLQAGFATMYRAPRLTSSAALPLRTILKALAKQGGCHPRTGRKSAEYEWVSAHGFSTACLFSRSRCRAAGVGNTPSVAGYPGCLHGGGEHWGHSRSGLWGARTISEPRLDASAYTTDIVPVPHGDHHGEDRHRNDTRQIPISEEHRYGYRPSAGERGN